ncbi:hypothetical protein BGZ60DRAFT_413357 [Tricladium varicosporioides]|nr:hypothetical protein BGZ60DRAFT_413357 [Hymenoscyphus varicosporioides]
MWREGPWRLLVECLLACVKSSFGVGPSSIGTSPKRGRGWGAVQHLVGLSITSQFSLDSCSFRKVFRTRINKL